MSPRTVFLIRSDGPNWAGLRVTVACVAGVRIVGEATSIADARTRVLALRPDVIVSAAMAEGVSTLPLLAELRARLPEVTIATFGGRYTNEDLDGLAALHAAGDLLWSDLDDPTFPHALIAVLGGTFTVCSREVAVAYIEAQRRRQAPAGAEQPARLSPRLHEVLSLLAVDLNDKEIAARLGIEVPTVNEYVTRLRRALGARTRPGVVALAFRQGLLR